jgi:hypothetical protein
MISSKKKILALKNSKEKSSFQIETSIFVESTILTETVENFCNE